MKKLFRNDLILISIILTIALLAFFVVKVTAKKGNLVKVTVNGKTVSEYPLEKDAEYKIETDYGYNVLVIKNESAYVTKADCRDKICQHHHAIKNAGESIVCLPHKLAITIVEGD